MLRASGDEVTQPHRAAQEVARWFPAALAPFPSHGGKSAVFSVGRSTLAGVPSSPSALFACGCQHAAELWAEGQSTAGQRTWGRWGTGQLPHVRGGPAWGGITGRPREWYWVQPVLTSETLIATKHMRLPVPWPAHSLLEAGLTEKPKANPRAGAYLEVLAGAISALVHLCGNWIMKFGAGCPLLCLETHRSCSVFH